MMAPFKTLKAALSPQGGAYDKLCDIAASVENMPSQLCRRRDRLNSNPLGTALQDAPGIPSLNSTCGDVRFCFEEQTHAKFQAFATFLNEMLDHQQLPYHVTSEGNTTLMFHRTDALDSTMRAIDTALGKLQKSAEKLPSRKALANELMEAMYAKLSDCDVHIKFFNERSTFLLALPEDQKAEPLIKKLGSDPDHAFAYESMLNMKLNDAARLFGKLPYTCQPVRQIRR